jgi:preprotein translocase subunit SecD
MTLPIECLGGLLRSKSLSRWLLILAPIVAAAVLLWPTINYSLLTSERSELAADTTLAGRIALAKWDSANAEAMASARAGRLKLGLDLRGGTYLTLEVDVLKLIESSADAQAIDDDFKAIIEKTRQQTDNTDLDVLTVFLENFRAKGKSLINYFPANPLTEEAVQNKLRRDADEAVEQAQIVLSQRINKFNVSEVNIQKQGTRRLVIEMPDEQDTLQMRKLLSQTARLEFKRVMMDGAMIKAMYGIDQAVKNLRLGIAAAPVDSVVADTTAKDSAAQTAKADTAKADTSKVAAADTAKKGPQDPYKGLSDAEKVRRIRADFPFTYMVFGSVAANEESQPQSFDLVGLKLNNVKPEDLPKNGIFSFRIPAEKVDEFSSILNDPRVRASIPGNLDILISATGNVTKKGVKPDYYEVYGVSREADLVGDVIQDAYPSFDNTNKPVVMMSMNDEGSEEWSKITGANIGKRIAVVLDDRVWSAPTVQNKISNGSSQISGAFAPEDANRLAVVLKAGALKAPVKIIEERVVGPSLGEDSIRRGLTSSAISFALIIVFMLAYYAVGGAIADVALVMNGLLVVAGLAAFGGTLTLPGIAALILSTAMAVDANILIFERMREEMYAGKTLKTAVEQGFNRAWSAILDSNLTNIIGAIPLMIWGSGPIKGFAITLLVGAVITLFTAVVVTRAVFQILIMSGATTLNIGQKRTV